MKERVTNVVLIVACAVAIGSLWPARAQNTQTGVARAAIPYVVTTAAPAAGAQSITTVPAGKYWRLVSWRAPFTSDSTVLTRAYGLTIDDGTNTIIRLGSNAATGITASLAWEVNASHALNGAQISGGNLAAPIALPDPTNFVLQPGWHVTTWVQSGASSMPAGDQWGIAKLYVIDVVR